MHESKDLTVCVRYYRWETVQSPMPDQPLVALDLEAVLANTMRAAFDATDNLDEDEIRGNWDMDDRQFQVYMGVTDALWRHNPLTIDPLEPTIERHVRDIASQCELHIVTKRLHVDSSLLYWLNTHNIEFDNFMSTNTDKWKLDRYDVFVDDNPTMAGNCRLLLRDQPWNQHIDVDTYTDVDRIHSLADVPTYL